MLIHSGLVLHHDRLEPDSDVRIRDDEDVRKRPGWQTDQHDLWLGSQQVES